MSDIKNCPKDLTATEIYLTHGGLVARNKEEFLNNLKDDEHLGCVNTIDYLVRCNDIWVFSYTDSYGDSKDDVHAFAIYSLEQSKNIRGFQIAATRTDFDSAALARGFDDHYDGKGNDGKGSDGKNIDEKRTDGSGNHGKDNGKKDDGENVKGDKDEEGDDHG